MKTLRCDQISKAFAGVQALDKVSFAVQPGKVHALCGENGAGKSTLLKILSGVYRPDSGSLIVGEKTLDVSSPQDALHAGVAVIYQELNLVPQLTVAENIFLGNMPDVLGWVSRRELAEKANQMLEEVGLNVSPNTRLGSLSLAQRQMVEIAKALSRNAQIIAFDEPTSSLSTREVERLFKIIEQLRAQNKVILYVSHRMDEIFSICDAATVLRDGQHVETFEDIRSINADVMINRMVGRSLEDTFGHRSRNIGVSKLEVEELIAHGLTAPANLVVRSGEIVGVFGLVGSGRTELLKAIFGAVPHREGVVRVNGAEIHRSPSQSIYSGIMLCPEDRKSEGIIAIRSVQENINISCRRSFSYFAGVINDKRERQNASEQITKLSIKTPSMNQPIVLLSGGNQQKTILARWMSEEIEVLMLDEPTRGIDVGAKREIYETLFDLAEKGIGILFVSSELPEILGLADRILVMRQGRLVADVARADATQESLLRLALPDSELATSVPGLE